MASNVASSPPKGADNPSKSPPEEEKKCTEDEKEVNWHDSTENGVADETSVSEGGDDDDDSDENKVKTVTTTAVPLVSLSSGIKHKASPMELHSWVALALTLDGRDKVTKLFQYTARTLAWWFVGTNQAQRFNALKASLTISRKAYRLGRSLIEFHRLRSMGLLETIGWHLRQHAEGDDEPPPNPKCLYRRASSNIGWGPMTMEESQPPRQSRRLLRSLSSMAYRMYRPMASTLSVSGQASKQSDTPMWKLVGSAVKMLGLFGFWTGDNIAFLTSSGMFDDYRLDKTARLEARKVWQTRASQTGNRCYFAGSVAGLVVNLRSYLNFRNTTLRQLQQQVDQADDEDEAAMSLEKANQKQFVLFLALVKSCCDVLVFSNNPGIDLWKKRTGRKMHEGFHCLCG